MRRGFLKSFKPILLHFKSLKKPLKKYRLEIFLLFVAVILALISIGIYLTNQQEEKISQEFSPSPTPRKIFVDIAGEVIYPDVYEITEGARLKDILKMAGGLSANADRKFFSRNFNLAKIIEDQEKIYIPSTYEVENFLFQINNQQINIKDQPSNLININTADQKQLEQLPGVGEITSQKIIDGRPYEAIEDLITKKVVNQSVYKKIKDLITVN